MPLFPRTLTLVSLGLALSLSACTDVLSPDEVEPQGLFDDSPLLPALSAADAGEWQWIAAPGMQCRNGSDTGFGLRRAAGSPDLLVLLQGGGACFDFLTCLLNPNSYSQSDFNAEIAEIGESGVFSRAQPTNPFQDWNIVYVPYCTGDIHAGNAPNTLVPFVGRQDFVGYQNIEAVLDLIDGPAQRARQVVLSGVSAGGFGTIGTYGLFADRLAPAPVDLLDDSGPAHRDDAVLSPSLQQTWRDLWNLDDALPAGCPDSFCNQPDGDGLEFVLPYYAQANPDRRFGLLSYKSDAVIRAFFGGVSAQAYEDGLFDLRAIHPPNIGTYYVDGEDHTFLLSNTFYSTTVEGVPMTSWVTNLLNGQPSDLPATQSVVVAQAE